MTYRCKRVVGRTLIFLILISALLPIPGTAGDIAAVRESLNSIDWQVRLATVEKLRNARDRETVDLLMEVVSTKEERTPVKMTAIQLLGEAGDPRAIEVLLPVIDDATLNWECPALKSYTAMALGNFKGDSRVVEALIRGIDDQELLTREASIKSLGKIQSRKAVPHLIRVLDDGSVSIRLSAVAALGEIGDPQAIPHLERIAESDSDPVVKDQARIALGKFRDGTGKN